MASPALSVTDPQVLAAIQQHAAANGAPVDKAALQRYLAAGAHPEGGAKAPHLHPAACRVGILDADRGQLVFEPPREKLAIVGFSQSTMGKAPFGDPTWVIAGLNQLGRYLPRADFWFELHQRAVFEGDIVRGTDYVQWLKDAPFPVFMEADDYDAGRLTDFRQAVRFPIEECTRLVGALYRPDGTAVPLDYYESTIAMEIAWGCLMGFKEIGIWGVDLIIGEEWDYQKPNTEFWLGFCQARGIKLTLPEESALLKPSPRRYGHALPDTGPFSVKFFTTAIQNAETLREELITKLNNLDGGVATLKNLRDAQMIYDRGGRVQAIEAAKGR